MFWAATKIEWSEGERLSKRQKKNMAKKSEIQVFNYGIESGH